MRGNVSIRAGLIIDVFLRVAVGPCSGARQEGMHLMVDCLDGMGYAGAVPLVGGLAVLAALVVQAARRERESASYAAIPSEDSHA
jgi:hypothetical protein